MRSLILLAVSLFCIQLNAQFSKEYKKWIGVNHLYFKQKSELSDRIPTSSSTLPFLERGAVDNETSFALFFRSAKDNGMYQQLDLIALNWGQDEHYTKYYDGDDVLLHELKSLEEQFGLQIAYQKGKMFSLSPKLSADVGLRGFFFYEKTENPIGGPSSFRWTLKSRGGGLNIELGLNYQIGKHLNVGYYVVPVSMRVYWNEVYEHNVFFPIQYRYTNTNGVDVEALKSLLDFKNFHIAYIF